MLTFCCEEGSASLIIFTEIMNIVRHRPLIHYRRLFPGLGSDIEWGGALEWSIRTMNKA